MEAFPIASIGHYALEAEPDKPWPADWPDVRHLPAAGYEFAAHVVPDYDNAQIVAHGRYETTVYVPPATYLWGLAGSSSDAAGFRCQIIDDGTKTPLFNGRTKYNAVTGGSIQGASYPVHVFHQPRLVLEPGRLVVQIESLATAASTIQLVLYTAEPLEVPR